MPFVIRRSAYLHAERKELPGGVGYFLPVNFLIEEVAPSSRHLPERNDYRGEVENLQNGNLFDFAHHENRERAGGESAVNRQPAVADIDNRKEGIFGVDERFYVENNVPEPCPDDATRNDRYH